MTRFFRAHLTNTIVTASMMLEKGDGEHRFRERLLPMSRQRNDDASGPGYPALFEAFSAVRSRLVTRSSWFAVAGKAAFFNGQQRHVSENGLSVYNVFSVILCGPAIAECLERFSLERIGFIFGVARVVANVANRA